jgi:hypothetical protein
MNDHEYLDIILSTIYKDWVHIVEAIKFLNVRRLTAMLVRQFATWNNRSDLDETGR